MYHRSETGINKISDGTSNTYLAGEKYMNVQYYEASRPPGVSRTDFGDNQSLYAGFEWDNQRRVGVDEDDAAWPPILDNSEDVNWHAFGSAHPGGWNAVLCDGSVQTIGYSIDVNIHHALGNRNDGQVVDKTEF